MLSPQAIAARQAGLFAALEPSDPREVPEEHAGHAEEWLIGYDTTITAMRNQRPLAA